MAKCGRRTDILFANIHAACNEITAILEKVVSYARQRKAKEDRGTEAMRPRRRRRRFDIATAEHHRFPHIVHASISFRTSFGKIHRN